MTLELELPDFDGDDKVAQTHEFLAAAVKHLKEGGTITVTKNGVVLGVADSVRELFKLALK